MSSITLGDSGKFITSLLVSYDDILILVPPFLALCAIYRRLEPSWSTSRQHAWVLTTLTSALMTLVSIPLLADYLSSGGDVKSVRALPILTYTTCRFFQAYLLASVSCSLQIPSAKKNLQFILSDLTMGLLYYRSEVNLLTGWVHHLLYVCIVQYTIRRGWANIFCLCALMEVRSYLVSYLIFLSYLAPPSYPLLSSASRFYTPAYVLTSLSPSPSS